MWLPSLYTEDKEVVVMKFVNSLGVKNEKYKIRN